MEIGEWFVLALTCAVGVVGLLLASSQEGATYPIGMALFVAAVAYAFLFIKRHFDRLEQAHR